jgi:hypothetical protein
VGKVFWFKRRRRSVKAGMVASGWTVPGVIWMVAVAVSSFRFVYHHTRHGARRVARDIPPTHPYIIAVSRFPLRHSLPPSNTCDTCILSIFLLTLYTSNGSYQADRSQVHRWYVVFDPRFSVPNVSQRVLSQARLLANNSPPSPLQLVRQQL